MKKFCPNMQQYSRAQPISSMTTTSVASPLPRGNGAYGWRSTRKVPQIDATSQGTHPRFYAMPTRPTAEASNIVVTCILTVCSLDAHVLMDLGSNFSYFTLYFTLDFEIEPEQLLEPFSVSTPFGYSSSTSRIYRGCVILIQDRHTMADVIELDIIDFDIIMGMD